jgi:hypothetical protein
VLLADEGISLEDVHPTTAWDGFEPAAPDVFVGEEPGDSADEGGVDLDPKLRMCLVTSTAKTAPATAIIARILATIIPIFLSISCNDSIVNNDSLCSYRLGCTSSVHFLLCS